MTTRITFACVLTALTAACTSSPTQPNSTAAGAPSIGAPLPVQPVNGALVAFSQPVTLVTKNAVVTGSGAPTL